MERCQNCGRTIGNLETPCVWHENVVCRSCYSTLASSVPPPVPPPVPPLRPAFEDPLSQLNTAVATATGQPHPTAKHIRRPTPAPFAWWGLGGAALFILLIGGFAAYRYLHAGQNQTRNAPFAFPTNSNSRSAPAPIQFAYTATSKSFVVSGVSLTLNVINRSDLGLECTVTLKNITASQKLDILFWGGLARERPPYFNDKTSGDLTDDAGNHYDRGMPSQIFKGQSLYPGDTLTDTLYFERPVSGAKTLYLKLPGGNIGESKDIVISIPMSAVPSIVVQ